MSLDLARFGEFCGKVIIPSRDKGMVPLEPLYGTQQHLLNEIARGLEHDIHDFITLKGGRQIGGSTILDALTLWWLQEHEGMVGEMVSDDQANMKYRRKVMRGMLRSLPKAYRFPVNQDNLDFLEWAAPNRSTLVFEYAGLRAESNLGRSKGLNYLYADEVGSWPDQKAVSALEAALSEVHLWRLYNKISTARGFNVFKEMWDSAAHAVSTIRIFLAWWQHLGYQVARSSREFKAYGQSPMTSSERVWIAVVKKRYRHTVSAEQLAWYRWRLHEKFYGDEAMLAQEFACLPEDAFQAFGDKFIEPARIQQLRLDLGRMPRPKGLRYEFRATLDETANEGVKPCDLRTAPLKIWEEPAPDGVYVVSAHPAWSSSSDSTQFVCEVFRVWPDQMVQVAEYASDDGAMYQFAWVILHLAGAYRTFCPAYLIIEVSATGYKVLEEIQMLERYGYGLSKAARGKVQDFLGSVTHYFYNRPDNVFARTGPQEWKTQGDTRPWILHGLRDTIERGHMTIRSERLIDELAAVRRGEEGDNDEIAGGAGASDARVICSAMAVECWLRTAMGDLETLISPKETDKDDPTHAGGRLIQNYLGHLLIGGRR